MLGPCEICGRPGNTVLSPFGFMATLCCKHAREANEHILCLNSARDARRIDLLIKRFESGSDDIGRVMASDLVNASFAANNKALLEMQAWLDKMAGLYGEQGCEEQA